MSEEKKLKGIHPSIVDMNYALYGCADPDSPNISPEMRKKMDELCRPKADGFKGMPIITSTTGDNQSGIFFKELWDKSNK